MPETLRQVMPLVANNGNNIVYLNQNVVPQVIPTRAAKLKKDGTPKNTVCNKRKGEKSEVFNFTIDDMRRMLDYLSSNEKWLHYMMLVLSCNMARRNGDMLNLTWKHFFNPATGEFREDILEINEQKTDKYANPHINSAVRAAIMLYIEKTGCDPSANGYNTPICMQLSGTYKGRVLSYSGCLKGLKDAARALGIQYNVGTHSTRKTFGAMSRMIHPNDYDSMELLQTIYNHSSSSTTRRYIGLTREKVNKYYDDMGDFFGDYVTGDKEYVAGTQSPIVSMGINDLREVIKSAYNAGMNNASATDAMVHMDAFDTVMRMVEQFAK